MNKIEKDNLIKIVIDARDGVEGAFEKLYAETIKFSYGVARVLLKNEEDIEDVLQNSYMYVARYIKTLKNPERFESWLGTIIRHECQKSISKDKRINDIFASIISSKKLEISSSEHTFYEQIEKLSLNESIREIVENLPDDKRVCIVLYYFEQCTISEIAEILGIPEGTVKSRLYNGRKILEREFKKLQKKDETLYGLSVIPLVISFFTYQLKNLTVPAAITEGSVKFVAAASAEMVGASAGNAAAIAEGTATGSSAAGTIGSVTTAAATKVTAVAVAAAVAVGGGVASVSYVKNKTEVQTTLSSQALITEGVTTVFSTEESSVLSTAPRLPTDITSRQAAMQETEVTLKAISSLANVNTTTKTTTFASTTTQKVTTVTTSVTTKQTITKPTTEKITTTKLETTHPTTTDATDVYDVSDGILYEYTGNEGSVSIPSEVNGNEITAIGSGAFSGNKDIAYVQIPSTVTKIGQEAFSGCTNLKSITLTSSVQSIGIGAFCGCTNLTGVSIPPGVKIIGDDAFADCSSLSTVTVPQSVTSIGDNVFGGCENITVKCSEGSAAHGYAVANSLNFELI